MKPQLQRKPDVCLLLEGTYPYVSGGVSTWVHQTITALPEIQFSLFFIGSHKEHGVKYKYTLPSNIIAIEEVYLHEPVAGVVHGKPDETLVAAIVEDIRKLILVRNPEHEAATVLSLSQGLQRLGRKCDFESFWKHPLIWLLISEVYEQLAPEESFLDFYYAVQGLCEPVWKLAVGCDRIPPARMYHSLCTGYAGFAAGLASSTYGSSFLLSEHGIYVRERIADLHKARWIQDPPVVRPSLLRNPSMLRQMWIEFFQVLGRFAYQTSNYVTSLFEKNAKSQVEFGAEPKRIEIIPNGINVSDFYQLRGKRRARRQTNANRMNVGFLGRVVQIKDVKTLLKAARLVVDELPQAQFLIAGPMDEEKEYAQECQNLTQHLSLENNVKFLGSQKISEFLLELDIMLLTSISEGLPFVILESFAAGIPVVSTDVGACRELIEGRPDESPSYGPAGFVVPVGDAEMLASGMIRILTDPQTGDQMGESGRLRAETLYSNTTVVNRYRQLYQLTPKDFTRTGLVSKVNLAAKEAAKPAAAPTL
jgi:polysaccharide biosynthesis protein PelF